MCVIQTPSIVSSQSAQRSSIFCLQGRSTCRGIQLFRAHPLPSSALNSSKEPLFGLFKDCRPFNNHDGHQNCSHATGTAHQRCLRRGLHASLERGVQHQAAPAASDASSRLQNAQNALQKQQQRQQSSQPPANLQATKSLVETAMLAAVSGLAYTLATLLKLESYLGYFLPMPVIVAAMRSGPASGRKTMTATCFLLLLLLGPLRALDYFFSHGLLAVVLGAFWHLKSHWSISLLVGAVTRLIGLLGYFYITAWMLKEDLFSLLLNNVYSLLDRIAGGSGTPSLTLVLVMIAALLIINCTLYVALLHAVYIPMLQGMGYQTSKLPKFVWRVVARRTGQFAQ